MYERTLLQPKLENGDDTGDTRDEKKDFCRAGGGDNINPKYVFGKEFNEAKAKEMCESTATVRGGKLDEIRFTRKGEHICKMACKSIGFSILTIKPTILMLVDKYCTREGLKPVACVCNLKVLCREKIYHAFITVVPNNGGGIAMSFSEAGQPPKSNSIVNPNGPLHLA
ncbi:Hypothetical protein CINCED_3A025348 [Cinara cedri]|uniref:Uncharacterized protein n=1 Tax=Cinara cedri TaxID=506608 RepID=A0A5E4M7E8_9HEMI|nr:Hypothetical protein CINCED_3A025348 [Cinara cedri]